MPDRFRALCPECAKEQNVIVHAEYAKDWVDGDEHYRIDGKVELRIVECGGCEAIFFHRRDQHSENSQYWENPVTGEHEAIYPWVSETWPKPHTGGEPSWLDRLRSKDELLVEILTQVYQAKSQDMTILATVGLRTALDRSTEVLGIHPALTFREKLDALLSGDWIGVTERDTLDALAEAGHGAAHRGWSPEKDQLEYLCQTLELFIQRAFLGMSAEELRKGVPAKPKRLPKPPEKKAP